jgi:[citrate (pro-3S)-lyase] ligase
MNYTVSEISPSDQRGQKQFDCLLEKAGIKRDRNLDYTAGIYNNDDELVAGGACFANALRCLAVDEKYHGEGLMALIISHLTEYQMAKGNRHLFLHTKCENADIFSALGFYEIERVENKVLLMENRKTGFSDFLANISSHKKSGKNAAVVVNCNPFTLGHRYLVERAAAENDTVHLFVVSEDISLFPFANRYMLVKEGCRDLLNVVLHTTKNYMVSSSVFPSYFLKDETSLIEVQARLDTVIFNRIAKAVGVQTRYVGEEPFSLVTNVYNKIMCECLPPLGIECIVVPRKEHDTVPISASRVRKLLQEGHIEECKDFVPPTTYDYFFSENGRNVISEIQKSENVVHY